MTLTIDAAARPTETRSPETPSPETRPTRRPCPHRPKCPPAAAPNHDAAAVTVLHPEQGWSLLCNGVVVFDDTGELLPGGEVVEPHRPTDTPVG